MLMSLGWFALGLLLLALGGDSIVKGAAGLSRRLGASPFIAGLVLVAIGTSLPELAVNLHAIWRGEAALALGNAVGSNVANIGLTLGAAALAAPLLVRWRALSPLLACLLAGTVVVAVLGLDGVLSRVEGLGLVLAFVAVLAFALARSRREAPGLQAEIEGFTHTSSGLGLNLLRFLVAAALLYFGARYVVDGALGLGPALGMSPLLLGLLPVAIGTALPEMAAAIAAARRGQGDMVMGHVIGASLFNLLVVVGGMAAFHPVPVPESFVRLEWPAAFVFALMLVPMLRGDMRLERREGGVLLLAFAAWAIFELLTMR